MRTALWVVCAVLAVVLVAVFALLSGRAAASKSAPNENQRSTSPRVSRSVQRLPWLAVASIPPVTAQTPGAASAPVVSPVTPGAGSEVGRGSLPKTPRQDPTVWDRLAFCESRGRWNINTGNGYYGGLQENEQFWRSYGDPAWARPDLAPKSEQVKAAVRARGGGRGYTPWPQCARALGLLGGSR